MRPHNRISLGLGLAVIACMSWLFAGCSGDGSSSEFQSGQLTDPDFMAVQNEIGVYIDSTLSFMTAGLSNLSVLPGDSDVIVVQYGPTPNDSVYATYVYQNGWHIETWSGSFTDAVSSFIDSIQFLDSTGQPLQNANNLETLVYKRDWIHSVKDTMVSHTDLAGNIALTLDNVSTGTATVNGTQSINISVKTITDSAATEWRDISLTGTISDLAILKTPAGWSQNCPLSGSISGTASMTFQVEGGSPVTTEWYISVTFADGYATVQVSQGYTVWSYSEHVCFAPNL